MQCPIRRLHRAGSGARLRTSPNCTKIVQKRGWGALSECAVSYPLATLTAPLAATRLRHGEV